MDKGFFKGEGLDAEFITTTASVLVRAAIAKEIEFVPIPGGGAEAMLKGAPLAFIVGESLISQWTITTTPEIKQVEDLKGKTVGLERPGAAAYTEAVVVLGKFFKMEPGKDYKVITFNAEPDRVAALINKSIQAAILSFPHAARAEKAGMKIMVKTGDYIPRLGGTFITHRDVRQTGDVGQRQIHRDPAHNRRIVFPNDHPAAGGELSIQSVRIPHRQNRDACSGLRDIGSAVAEGLIRAHIAQAQDASFPGEHGFYPQPQAFAAHFPPGTLEGQIVAIESEAGAHHVVPGMRPGDERTGIGGVEERGHKVGCLEQLLYFCEVFHLRVDRGRVEHLGGGEMGGESFHHQVRGRLQCGDDLRQIFRGDTQPSHAGVHFQMNREPRESQLARRLFQKF